MKQINVAVVGCGSISDIYMSNITSGKFQILKLIACNDLMVERMEASAAKYGCKAMTLDEICADPTIDMVINLTIPAAHYPVIKQCLEAGKHVFSEKMIAVELWQGNWFSWPRKRACIWVSHPIPSWALRSRLPSTSWSPA